MSDTLLKKEFAERDVQRLRNIVQKKYGDSTQIQIGYTKTNNEHVEGDIWEENNKWWTIKDGLKQTYTRLDFVKKALRVPLACPECSQPLESNADKKMYHLYNKCQTCVAKFESKLKMEGKYQDYVKNIVQGNILSALDEAKQFIEEFETAEKDNYVTEHGDIEKWQGDMNTSDRINVWKKEMEDLSNQLKN